MSKDLMDSIVCKKPKYESVKNRDRLSELPEALIVEILSLLPIEEAVRSGVLSRRWRNLWNHIDKIAFNYRTTELRPSLEKRKNYMSFVDHILMQCVCLKTFSFRSYNFYGDHFLHEHLHKWFQWVYSRKVENIYLNISGLDFTPPEWFYHNSNLVKLKIRCLKFTILGPVVTWTSLKSLSLKDLTIGDEQFAKILSGCPLLEDLDLQFGSFKSLNITSPRLVKLSMAHLEDLLEINAPSSLQLLKLLGSFRSLVRLTNFSSLVHANLNFDSFDYDLDVVTKVLESLYYVQELTIGRLSIPVLSMWKQSGKPCPLFSKCKRMTFITSVYKHDLSGITHLLKSSHHLETLVIEVRKYFEDEEVHEYLNEICDFEDMAVYLNMESGDFPHLKTIEVVYCNCEDRVDEEEFSVFELVTCILKKAPAFEKLVITPERDLCKVCSRNHAGEDASVLSKNLLESLVDREGLGEWKLRKKKNSCFEIVFY